MTGRASREKGQRAARLEGVLHHLSESPDVPYGEQQLAWQALAEEDTDAPSFGEANGMAKLTRLDVEAIREAYHVFMEKQDCIAKRFGVDSSQISRIVNGHTWRD